jgi:hypothetical protein
MLPPQTEEPILPASASVEAKASSEAVSSMSAQAPSAPWTRLSLPIAPDGTVPAASVPCTGTDATLYIGYPDRWPGIPGIKERVACEGGIARFSAFGMNEFLGPRASWESLYPLPLYYVVKNTTGLAPGFDWGAYHGPLNLNGSFNGFRHESYHIEDDEWPTLAAGPAFAMHEDGTWHDAPAYAGTDAGTTTATSTPAKPPAVLFIPGIEGSRLHKDGRTLWEPGAFGSTLPELALDERGASAEDGVYAREDDLISSFGPFHFFDAFMEELDAMKDDGVISAWKAAPYDWRYSAESVVARGREEDGRIYYADATSTPYIEQTLRALAAGGGKVSIVAYSNGGLVAKALMLRLEEEGAASLVDKLILVGAPQAGTPHAIGAMLYGYGQALPYDRCADSPFRGLVCGLVVNRGQARALTLHMPSAYELLPSRAYFETVDVDASPLVRFRGERMYGTDMALYGDHVGNGQDFRNFLTGSEDGRGRPAEQMLDAEEVLSPELLASAGEAHARLDAWTPPEGLQIYQIAGWGIDTVSGVDLHDGLRFDGILGYKKEYSPLFTEDGDGTVVAPSALLMPESDRVQNYWVDLKEAERTLKRSYAHGNIFQLSSVQDLIRDILAENPGTPAFVRRGRPQATSEEKRLVFILHSPLSLEIEDAEHAHAGMSAAGDVSLEIIGSRYGTLGDAKYVIVPEGSSYVLSMQGMDAGSFSLEVREERQGEVIASTTFAGLPVTTDTTATLSIGPSFEEISSLEVDETGDGVADISLAPVRDEVVPYHPPLVNVPTPVEELPIMGPSRRHSSSASHREESAPNADAKPRLEEPVPLSAQPLAPSITAGGAVLGTSTGSQARSAAASSGDAIPHAAEQVPRMKNLNLWSRLLYTIEQLLESFWKAITHLLPA